MLRFTAVSTLAVTALLASAASAQADLRLAGSCDQIEGTVKLALPLSGLPRANSYAFAGTGRCTGVVGSTPVQDEPITIAVAGSGMLSCGQTSSTSPGEGLITLTRGTETTSDDVTFQIGRASCRERV
jgi:hypothetical protein